MNRTLLAAGAALLAAPLLLATPAFADTLTLHGERLVFTSATDDDATIDVDGSLSGTIRVTADDPSCLTTHAATEIVVDTGGCGGNLGHVTILVPPGFKLTVDIQNSGNVTVGNTGGDLDAHISGSGDLHAGRVGNLALVTDSGDSSIQAVNGAANLNSNGSGDIHITELNGLLHSRQAGGGDLVIGQIASPAVDIAQFGSGDAVLGRGSIGALRAELTSSGDLAVAANVATADLNATGGGDIHIAHVSGPVTRHASGGSSIHTSSLGGTSSLLNKLASVGTTTITGSDGQTINISDDDSGTNITIGGHHDHGSGLGHFLAGIAVLFLLVVIWRAVQRRGGIDVVTSQIRARRGPPGQPTHPGVIAVRDKLAELEAKLARVESYVTNREFDLHRKFRELDTP
jgi:hypothetical protein